MGSEASAEIARLVLTHGRPVKDEEWVGGEWRDFDWDHLGSGCAGWQRTGQSEVVKVPFGFDILYTVTHCRCACRVFPLVTIGLEGTLG